MTSLSPPTTPRLSRLPVGPQYGGVLASRWGYYIASSSPIRADPVLSMAYGLRVCGSSGEGWPGFSGVILGDVFVPLASM